MKKQSIDAIIAPLEEEVDKCSASEQPQESDSVKLLSIIKMLLDDRLSSIENKIKEIQEKPEYPSNEEYSYSSYEEEEDINNDSEFMEEVQKCLRPNQFILEDYQNWVLILTKKEYMVPFTDSLSPFQKRSLEVSELVREDVFACSVLQYGEDREDEMHTVKALKQAGIKVNKISKLSYVKRVLMEM